MKRTKEAFIVIVKFLGAIISSSIIQIFLLIGLGLLYIPILLSVGSIIYNLGTKSPNLNWNWNIIAEIVVYLILALIYGAAWFVYWTSLYKERIKWFYSRMVFSILPLVFALKRYDPTPRDPDSLGMGIGLAVTSAEPIFSCLVTAAILLPVYSVLVYKFILQKPSQHEKRNTITVGLVTLLVGSLIFAASWKFMPVFYKGI